MENNTTNNASIKNCLHCSKAFRGRSDKKFCNDICRNNYNNRNKETDVEEIKNINRILLRNRQLLLGCLTNGMILCKIRKSKLMDYGFLFKYHTHTVRSKKGTLFHLCYDAGYYSLSDDWCLVFMENQLPDY